MLNFEFDFVVEEVKTAENSRCLGTVDASRLHVDHVAVIMHELMVMVIIIIIIIIIKGKRMARSLLSGDQIK